MRVAILDVGASSARLDLVTLRPHRPLHASVTVKYRTGLSTAVAPDGTIGAEPVEQLCRAVAAAVRTARRSGARELIAFATSVVRDAPDQQQVLDRVEAASGVRLGFLTGRQDARLTYLAARAWSGPDAGELVLADIGGGTVEVAGGSGPEADWALSLPLGARRLTLAALPDDPPCHDHVTALREHVAAALAAQLGEHLAEPARFRALATSRTFAQLARLTRPHRAPERLTLRRGAVRAVIPLLAAMPAADRARLDGVSASRARHILAGAIVAEALMDTFRLSRLHLCPWALREGVALRRREQLELSCPAEDIDHLRHPLPGR